MDVATTRLMAKLLLAKMGLNTLTCLALKITTTKTSLNISNRW
jgi:hypothetical protein